MLTIKFHQESDRICPYSAAAAAISGRFREFVNEKEARGQNLQTLWRRESDLNPRYPFGYSGFQVRWLVLLGYENFSPYLILHLVNN